MYRSTKRQAPRRAPARTAPRQSLPGGRPVRPGRPPRRTGSNFGPVVVLALIVVGLAAAGFFFWQSRQRAAAETGQAAAAAALPVAGTPAADGAAGEQTPGATPTATLPVISTGSIPGSGETAVAVSAVTAAPSPGDTNPA